jgi:regulator of sirC expression with transglutaminase-like and TPR domain
MSLPTMKPLRGEKKSPQKLFAAEVQKSEAELDLGRAALLIAYCENPSFDLEYYQQRLDQIAEAISKRLRAISATASLTDADLIIANINDYLFNELGLRGNSDKYYDPRNSYLNDLLDRRLGIPITISVLYLEIARRLGLAMGGVGMPGHFIVKCLAPGQECFIDPFNGGRRLSEKDCEQMVANIYGDSSRVPPDFLRVVSKKEILVRMLSNLKNIYVSGGDNAHALAVIERILLINPNSLAEKRDRGLLNFRLGRFSAALKDLEFFLAQIPEGPEAESVRMYIARIKTSLASLN